MSQRECPAKLAHQLGDLAYDILEPYAAFICKGEEDQSLYFIPPEVLAFLAWVVTNVIVPILTDTLSSGIAEKLKQKDRDEVNVLKKKITDLETELKRLREEVVLALEKLDDTQRPSNHQIMIARVSLVEILVVNGWPFELANRNADEIVSKFIEYLWPSEPVS